MEWKQQLQNIQILEETDDFCWIGICCRCVRTGRGGRRRAARNVEPWQSDVSHDRNACDLLFSADSPSAEAAKRTKADAGKPSEGRHNFHRRRTAWQDNRSR